MPYPRHPLRGCSCPQLHQPSNRVLPQNSQNSRKLLAENILPRISQMLTEASGCVYSPTDFTDAHRFLGCVFAPNLCTSVQSVGVFVGGYGILPYPRHPPRGCSCPSCTNQANRAYPPTEFTEFTEASGREYSPTDFTDAHRLGGYGILPYPRYPLRGCTCLKCTDQALVHQHCNPPTESTEFTETSGREEPPTDFTDAHRWLGCVRFCGFCGKIV